MNKFILIFLSGILFINKVAAQDDLKRFKCDVSLGYGIPAGSGAKGGGIFAVEPKFSVLPVLSVGLRMEIGVFARNVSSTQTTSTETEVKASASYLATADFYFSENYSFRPFAGVGVGIHSLAAATVDGYSEEYNGEAQLKLGSMIRAGFEARHFRLGVEYNLVPKMTYPDYYGNRADITTKNSYLGLKLGICIGGGPR